MLIGPEHGKHPGEKDKAACLNSKYSESFPTRAPQKWQRQSSHQPGLNLRNCPKGKGTDLPSPGCVQLKKQKAQGAVSETQTAQ